MARSKLPLILIAGGSALALLVLALFLMSRSGGSETTAQQTTVATLQPVEPTPTPEVTSEEPKGDSARGGAVFGTSVRDPFIPQATPEASDGSSSDSSKAKSSNPSPSKTTKSSQSQTPSKTEASGSGSGQAKTTKSKSDTTKDSGSKAPEPIGGAKTEGDTPAQQVEVYVLGVKDSAAVVRINGSRTTLYQNVPDVSGVTFVSSLGGGCGWFGMGDLAERMTICQGDSRQL
jgi:hypothetical protein